MKVVKIRVMGKIWLPPISASYVYTLSPYDEENIGKLTRENVENWLRTHAGDFQEILDFEVTVEEHIVKETIAEEQSEAYFLSSQFPDEEELIVEKEKEKA